MNDAAKFMPFPPAAILGDADGAPAAEELSEAGLSAAFVKSVHQAPADCPFEAILKIVGVDRRKTVDSDYAAGSKHQAKDSGSAGITVFTRRD